MQMKRKQIHQYKGKEKKKSIQKTNKNIFLCSPIIQNDVNKITKIFIFVVQSYKIFVYKKMDTIKSMPSFKSFTTI